MVSEPQENLAEAADVEKNRPALINMPSKGKKRRHGSGGGVRSESLIFITSWHSLIGIAAEAIVTRSAAKGRAVDDQAEAAAGTMSKRHAEDSDNVSK